MNVPDLLTWNLLNSCCGCGYPACDPNTIKCESLGFTSACADNDYTDDLREWTETRDEWINEPITDWQADLAAWLAEDPDREAADYPVPVPDPRDPEDYEVPEPTKPDGYDDEEHGCYLPFTRPEGEKDEEIPTIYQTLKYEHFLNRLNGEGYSYYNVDFGGGVGYEALGHTTIADDVESFEDSGNEVEDIGGDCHPITGRGIGVFPGDGVTWEIGEPELECTATTRTYSQVDTTTQGTIPLVLEGCPGPWTSTPEPVFAYDYTRTTSDTWTLGSGISKSDLISRARSNIPTTWPEEAEGSSCSAATTVFNWPLIKDGYVGADPDADPPVEGAWRTCESGDVGTAGATASSNKSRYKNGIPLKMQAHRLWIEAHAAWVIAHAAWDTEHDAWLAEDPDTRGEAPTEPEEPPEPQIFHYFALQWDVVFFPKKWSAWRLLYDAWKAAVAAHDAWEIAHDAWEDAGSDPDTEPEEPTIPTDPSEDQPDDRPVFIDENLFWVWTGGELEVDQYEAEWHEIDAPETEGETRIVNRQGKCMQSERTGVPPTPYGEIYNPDDYPE